MFQLRNSEEGEEDVNLKSDMLTPLVRSVAPNWKYANRREAGVVLAHVTGSGTETGKIVSAFSRVLKKVSRARNVNRYRHVEFLTFLVPFCADQCCSPS